MSGLKPYSTQTLAERWGCHPRTVRELIRKGELRPFRIGALVRIPAEEVERYECAIESRATVAAMRSSGTTKAERDTAARLARISGKPTPSLVKS